MKLAAFKFVRAMERHLPLPLLRASLWPIVELSCFRERPLRCELEAGLGRLPESWLDGIDIPRRLAEERRLYHYSRFINCWADRWREASWRERIDATQLAKLTVGKPLVIATLHAGRMWMMHYALRAYGLNAATLIGMPLRKRSVAKLAKDRLVAGEGPTVFSREQLKEACQFVRAGNCLVVAMDKPSEQMEKVNFGGVPIHMSTGAIRLAQANNAMLSAGLILETSPWRYEICVSEPLGDVRAMGLSDAMHHMAAELGAMISRFPMQCGVETIKLLG